MLVYGYICKRMDRLRQLFQTKQAIFLLGITLTSCVLWLTQMFLDNSHLDNSLHVRVSETYNTYSFIKTTQQKMSPSIPISPGKLKSPPHKKADENTETDTCPLFKLHPNATMSENVACRRADFVPGSCQIMKTLFKRSPADCSHQPTHIICEVEASEPQKPKAYCRRDACKKHHPISIGLYVPKIGEYAWHKMNSSEDLTSFIDAKLLAAFQDDYPNNGFCVIQCTNKMGMLISQLLVLPPVLRANRQRLAEAPKSQGLLNVNVLLLDSVSRHHFYRTLPKTVDELRSLNERYFRRGRVFDFELLQGIRGRTFESLQALFGGDASPLPAFNAFELPPKSVALNETFGRFKGRGYETLYVEDMCWQREWGLVKEQRAMNLSAPYQQRVEMFNEAVRKAGIDRLDVSFSSCLILQENNVTDVFHGPESICYNGIHQHAYLLSYMEYFIPYFLSLGRPTFTFLILDTGHEDTGVRIKQLDNDLSKHVAFLARQPNTVSFILSDHGNAYGHFVSASAESQVEIFHPFLFVMVTDDAAGLLGSGRMEALAANQNRLVSLIDVHFTLTGLLPSVKREKYRRSPTHDVNTDGLLSPVSPSRTCRDIPRLHPNLCICHMAYTTKTNSSYYALFAEFALGYLNKKIVELRVGRNKLGSCLTLRATRFDNIRVSHQEDGGETVVLLDLYVRSAGGGEEVFTVTLLYGTHAPMEGILFLGYSRLTPYSPYRRCAGPGADLKLCVCKSSAGNITTVDNGDDALSGTVSWARTHPSLVHRPCLYLLTRSYAAGVAMFISNTCSNIRYNIAFNFFTINLFSSNKMPVFEALGPGAEKILVVGVRKVESRPWRYKYTLTLKASAIK